MFITKNKTKIKKTKKNIGLEQDTLAFFL